MAEPVETAELVAFARVVDTRSISRAAVELGLPRATLSRRLARLEKRLRVRLLRRTTRSIHVTDAGQALYRHAQLVLEAVARAEASVRHRDGEIAGDLRISVPPRLPPSFAELVLEFSERHPHVRIELNATTRVVDLQRDGYDVAVRATHELAPNLIARKLLTDPAIAVASPQYLQAMGTPKTVRDLGRHRCLLGFVGGEIPDTHWPAGGGRKVHVNGVFASNDLQMLAIMALGGRGIALLPRFFVRRHLDDGELVQVLPGVVEVQAQIAVVYAERELMPPQVRAFLDALADWRLDIDEPQCREDPPSARPKRRASAGR